MDYDKLIENFKQLEFVAYNYNINGEVLGMGCAEFESVMADAALAIETLRADLARVTAERDALIKRTAGECWACIRRYECNSRKGPHRRCWEFDPRLLKED